MTSTAKEVFESFLNGKEFEDHGFDGIREVSIQTSGENIVQLADNYFVRYFATHFFKSSNNTLPRNHFVTYGLYDFQSPEILEAQVPAKDRAEFIKSSSWLGYYILHWPDGNDENKFLIPKILLNEAELPENSLESHFRTLRQNFHEIGHLFLHWLSLLPEPEQLFGPGAVNSAKLYMEDEAWKFAEDMAKLFHEYAFLSSTQFTKVKRIIEDKKEKDKLRKKQ